MPKISLTKDLIPLSEFRASASPVFKRLREKGGTVVVTHNGKAAAVMMGVQEYEGMLDQIEELKSMVSNLLGAVDKDKLVPHEEVMRTSRELTERQRKLREELSAV